MCRRRSSTWARPRPGVRDASRRRTTPLVAGLDAYLALLDDAYHAPPVPRTAAPGAGGARRILGSAYLGAVVPDTDAVHNVIGVTLLREGRYDEAAVAFREALMRRADSVDANRNLGTALAASGHAAEAIGYLRRAVQLAPGNGGAQSSSEPCSSNNAGSRRRPTVFARRSGSCRTPRRRTTTLESRWRPWETWIRPPSTSGGLWRSTRRSTKLAAISRPRRKRGRDDRP